MGKMVRTFSFKVHESKWNKRSTSTVPQEHEQSFCHPDRRFPSLIDCIYLGENYLFSSSIAYCGRLTFSFAGIPLNKFIYNSFPTHICESFGRNLFLADWMQPLLVFFLSLIFLFYLFIFYAQHSVSLVRIARNNPLFFFAAAISEQPLQPSFVSLFRKVATYKVSLTVTYNSK